MIYVELKNGVILPTKFPNARVATQALNDVGSFIEINGNSYNKYEIKRTFEMGEHPILTKMSQEPYDVQEAMWRIAVQRQKEGKSVNSYEQLRRIYEKEKSTGGLKKYGLPFFVASNLSIADKT